MKEPATSAKLAAAGVDGLGLQVAEFAAFLAGERKRYKTLAQERGIKYQE